MFLNESLQYYKSKFQKLKQGITQYGKAPHKPILLLSVIHQIEKEHITDNRICLTPDLVAEFLETFKLLVHTSNRAELAYFFN